MKYTFDVYTNNDIEHTIKIDIVQNGGYNSTVTRTLTFAAGSDNYVPSLAETLEDMINNMRLTVKEREDAMYNANVFNSYLQNCLYKENKQEIIVENGDPAVLIAQK